MRYELRNKKRGVTEADAWELLQRGEYGVLSTCGPDGEPYGIPLSYCLLGDAVYFHCAVTGRKLDNLAVNNHSSFCVVGKTELLPDKFATRYESVIISGQVAEVFDAEKQQALEGLVTKYSAKFHAEGLDYIKAAWEETKTYRISIEEISGKARRH